MHPIDIITISREFGAGGGELAAALGERLGWRVFERQLLSAVAERLGVDEAAVAARDEHAPGILERIGTSLLRTSPELISLPPDQSLPDPETVVAAVTAVLRAEAERPPLVIVGHGAQAIFRDRAGALHVRLVAPLEVRAERICRRAGCGGKEAVALAQRIDADRSAYLRRYFQQEWRDPLAYHLQLNTGRLGVPEATELVARLVASRAGAEAARG